MENFRFEELKVYQESIVFVDTIYNITKEWPRDELFGLTNQLRRAAVSIALNIAEGSSRSNKDFRRFLDLAKGSTYECVASLQIAKNREYIPADQYTKLYAELVIIAKMISKLKVGLQNKLFTNNQSPITNNLSEGAL